jgi:hypothetical protein
MVFEAVFLSFLKEVGRTNNKVQQSVVGTFLKVLFQQIRTTVQTVAWITR